jgi:transcriptional regulator with XRE-family HTH domain
MPLFISPTRLRAAREAAGLSRERAAVAIGRSYRSICQYEDGYNRPPANVLLALAEVYGVSVEDLTDNTLTPLRRKSAAAS